MGGLGDTVKGFTEQGTGTVDGLIGGLGGLGGLGTAKGGLTGARIGKKKRNSKPELIILLEYNCADAPIRRLYLERSEGAGRRQLQRLLW